MRTWPRWVRNDSPGAGNWMMQGENQTAWRCGHVWRGSCPRFLPPQHWRGWASLLWVSTTDRGLPWGGSWGWLWSLGQSGFNSLLKSLPTLCNPMDCSTLGFPVLHYLPEIFPKFMSTQLVMWILERVAISFSRGSFWPWGRTRVSCIAGGFFNTWGTREAHTALQRQAISEDTRRDTCAGLSGTLRRKWMNEQIVFQAQAQLYSGQVQQVLCSFQL